MPGISPASLASRQIIVRASQAAVAALECNTGRDVSTIAAKALLSAVLVPGAAGHRERLVLQGDVPSPINPPAGCHFHPRCPIAAKVCAVEAPTLRAADGNAAHLASCHLRTGDYRELDREIRAE